MIAITDTEIKLQGMDALIAKLGEVKAEKFIALIMREPFDYTEWQRNLWSDKSVEEISSMAMKHRKKMANKAN
jgi:hypothetical protein